MTAARFVQACHIVPHAKGHQYMTNLANHRHEPLDPPLDDISDTRNGILLGLQLHGPFGASEAAFLQTPNFAMTVNDVDLAMQPNADDLGFAVHPSNADRRLTFQHFINNDQDSITRTVAPHNSDARISNSDMWPPPLIFDVAYGCAALKTWGVPTFMTFARKNTKVIYYGRGDRDVSGSYQGEPAAHQAHDREARAVKRTKARAVHWEEGNPADSQNPDFADMVLALWMRNTRKDQHQALEMKVDRTREKVQTWLDSADNL